jgi:hypothetical protein
MNEYLLASPRRMTYVAPVFGATTLASTADDAQADQRPMKNALVAQLDRALDYESRGREFESSRARHLLTHLIYNTYATPLSPRGFRCVTVRVFFINNVGVILLLLEVKRIGAPQIFG